MSGTPTIRLLGEVESPRPLRAHHGLVAVKGWCFLAGEAEPPAVRLTIAADHLEQTARLKRTDLAGLHPNEPAAAHCGFAIEGRLPAGVHLARIEARLPDGNWQVLKTLSLAVEAAPFAAGIDAPAATGTLTKRVHIEGWALHPEYPVRELSLRYGHQEIACDLGRPRPDLVAGHSTSPHAAQAGFKSRVTLSAGRGPVRLKARLADGSTALARTLLQVQIDADENHGPELNLAATRIPLGGYTRLAPQSAARTSRPLNVLFVSHGHFTANSTLQIAALANELAQAGHCCTVAVPQDATTLAYQDHPHFRGMLHEDAVRNGGAFPNGRGPDIIHAWTTRESVRKTSLAIRAKHGGRSIVQLEDNEEEIREQQPLGQGSPADLTDPIRGREFLESADGVTLIIESLRAFVPEGKPAVTIWPAADARHFFPRPRPEAFRQALGIPDAMVLFYHGNVHATNAREMRELYQALVQLHEKGIPAILIRAGTDHVDFLGPLAARVRPHVLNLGAIHTHRHLPPLMALADIFVQPGQPDAFNDYRFPSKLPEFFALGRPVILPRTNLGHVVRHGTDAYVLDRADAAGIAAAVTELHHNPALRERLAQGARTFAEQHFSWRRSAEAVAEFYGKLATG